MLNEEDPGSKLLIKISQSKDLAMTVAHHAVSDDFEFSEAPAETYLERSERMTKISVFQPFRVILSERS